jgi:sugar/nucleoside kinase (ribokinase family)
VRFVAVGDVMVDVVCAERPPSEERVHADVFLRAGGSAVNAAVCAATLGAAASVVGRIGVDPAGDLVLAALAAHGVDAHVARDPELRTGAAVVMLEDGSVSVVADRGANARLSPADVPEPLEADALLVSGFALFQRGSSDAARSALDRFAGDCAGVDLGSPRLAARADLDAGIRGARVVFPTADEARAVTGAEPEDAARALASRFEVVCVKLGEDGALVAQGNHVERRRGKPVVRRSPFGAGDAFASSFLLSLAGGDSAVDALERACEAGARAAHGL